LNKTPSLTLVIPVHNGEATLPRCLDAVDRSTLESFEVIVVNDGSTDGTGGILEQRPVKVLRHERARGAAVARNAGAAEAKGDIVCFLDSDILIAPDTLAEVVRSFEVPEVDGVVGMLAEETEARNFSSQYENLYMHFMYLHHTEDMDIFYTSLAAVRRDVFEASGGFAVAYAGAGIEDMELGQRMVTQGRKLILNKKLQVVHLKRFRLGQLLGINRRKASGTLKIMLRNRKEKVETRKHVGPGWGFLVGIPGTPLALLSLVVGVVWSCWPAWMTAGLVLLGVAAANRTFLSFLLRKRGILFMIPAVGFFYLQFLNYGLGLATGMVEYAVGDRY